ncbi:DEAD/DEAH box helicase, partial [archaeon]
MELFAQPHKPTTSGLVKRRLAEVEEASSEYFTSSPPKLVYSTATIHADSANESANEAANELLFIDSSFSLLGLSDWLCETVASVGYRRPTKIQHACIPAILQGKDVIACAETGSGKTAAFVLPILQALSQDPYGIFALVLTPTRELAMQIAEQVSMLGAALSVSIGLVVGGLDIITQRLQLSRRPHFVVSTPGRLRHHLEGADAPPLSKLRFLVLDEADRLLSLGFSEELQLILAALGSRQRSTLLFSATYTSTLDEVQQLAARDTVRFDLTRRTKLPTTATLSFLFMPPQLKICYLAALLRQLLELPGEKDAKKDTKKRREKDRESEKGKGPDQSSGGSSSTVQRGLHLVFVQSCLRCEELCRVLQQLQIRAVSLNSLLTQSARSAALQAFRGLAVNVLVATDVA